MDGKTALVVDDDGVWRRILSDILEENGFKVYHAKDGLEAITKAYKYKPDVLVVDYFIPKVNGGHVVRILRRDPVFKNAGIAIISFGDEYVNEYWAKEYGADLFLMKKDGIEEIKRRLSNFLMLGFHSEKEATQEVKRDFVEMILGMMDEDLRRETVNRDILELLEYIDDEEYVMRKLESIFNKFADYDAFYSVIFSLTAGRLFILPVKRFTVSEPTTLRDMMMKLVRKPLTPAEWHYYGNFKVEEGEPVSIDLYFPVSFGGKEYGLVAFSGISKEGRKNLISLYKDISGSLGLLFRTLNHFFDYKVAATEDALTGLMLKSSILKKLSEMLSLAKRGNITFSVVMMDIDDFKKINDTYGHVTGDKVLKEIGSIIKSSIRETDHAGRYGGEEFLLILSGCDEQKGAEVVERLLDRIRKHDWKSIGVEKVTMSAGIAQYREGVSAIELVEMADSALYRAKRSGKDRVVRYGG